MLVTALLAALAAVGVLEAMLLQQIIFHPAAGPDIADGAFTFALSWAAIPLVWAALLIVLSSIRGRGLRRLARPLVWVALSGPILLFIGLRQYGHATPLFMMLGLLVQCIALIVGTAQIVRSGKPKTT